MGAGKARTRLTAAERKAAAATMGEGTEGDDQQMADATALSERKRATAEGKAKYDAQAEEDAAKARETRKPTATALAEMEFDAPDAPQFTSRQAEDRAKDHKDRFERRRGAFKAAGVVEGEKKHSRGDTALKFPDGTDRPLTADLPQETPVPSTAAMAGAMRRGYFPDKARPKNIPPAHVSDNISAVSAGPFGDEGPSGAGEGGVGLPASIGSSVQ